MTETDDLLANTHRAMLSDLELKRHDAELRVMRLEQQLLKRAQKEKSREGLIDTWIDTLPERLTAKEASQYLRLHQNTIYKWVRAGLIPCIRQGHKGRQIRFKLTDLLKWEQEQTTGKL